MLRRSLLAVVCCAAVAAAVPGSAAAGSRCKRAVVNGKPTCLKVGQRCKKQFQGDYVRVKLSCRRGKLRRATVADLRGAEPMLIDSKGRISLRTALAAFDQEIADLPGIEARRGEIGDLEDATMIVNEIQANLRRLSAKQRDVFRSLTTPAPDAQVIPGPAATPAQSQTIVGSGTLEERLEAVRFIGDARTVMQKHGFSFPHDIKVSFLERNVKIKGQSVVAYVPWDTLPPGRSTTCNMFVTKSGRASSVSFKRLFYAHETAHCAQHAFFSSQNQARVAPAWVIEGSADWIGGKAVEELGHTVNGVDWDPWLEHPETDLFKRAYSAAGFFAMLDQAAGDGWSRIAGVLTATKGGSQRAYLAALAGLPEVFHDRWGPGLARDATLGTEWEYTGPGIPKSEIREESLTKQPISFTLPAHASKGVKLDISADVVVVRKAKDIRGLLLSEGKRFKLPKAGTYCAKVGGCTCKSHTDLQLPQIAATAYAGFNTLHRAGTVSFEGRRLKDYCKKPKPGPAEGESCPIGTGPTTAQVDDTPTCPAPEPGVQVFGNPCDEQGNCTLLATFQAADCTVGGGFTAISTDGAWRLEVGIATFAGFGTIYDILWGGGNVNVVIEGPGGTYSNTTWVPPDAGAAGAVAFPAGTGSPVGVGWIEFRPASGAEDSGITGAGQMACAYPDDG